MQRLSFPKRKKFKLADAAVGGGLAPESLSSCLSKGRLPTHLDVSQTPQLKYDTEGDALSPDVVNTLLKLQQVVKKPAPFLDEDDDKVTWTITYEMVKDPNIVYKLIGNSHITGLARLYLSDGAVVMPIRDAIFHLIIWRIYHAFDMSITTKMLHRRPTVHAGAIADIQTKIMWDIRKYYPELREQLCEALFKFINYLYNFVVSELNAYACSMDIVGLSKLMNNPLIKEATTVTYKKSLGTDVIEKKITAANKELQRLLKDRNAIPPSENILLSYQETSQINVHQLPQVMIAYGPRTDVDDTIVLRPVMGNAINGLKNVLEYATESLSAKKSAFYNHVAVSDSQYFGRKQHLLTSSITTVYPGDCGSTVYMRFTLDNDNWRNLLGINALNPKTGTLYELTEANLTAQIGQTITIRNPISCKHTDGVCEACGGTLLLNIGRNVNLGILSAIHVIAPTTQKILSAKHLIKTMSLIYEVNRESSKYFLRINANEIHWKPDVYKKLPHWSMGISLKDMGTLHDIIVLNSENISREERFSKLHQIIIRDNVSGKTETLDMEVGKTCPFFTMDMLLHIRKYLQAGLEMDESVMWIPLEGTEKFSIFRTLVVNDNMMKFVKSVSNFLSSKIATHTSANEALQEFCDIVYSKVSMAHLTHISTIMKAYLVTNDYDYRIPVVEDPDHVKFKTTAMIIRNRTVGCQLAFQNLYNVVATPSTYIFPRANSVFDPLFNI